MQTGAIVHFPAGSYAAQMKRYAGNMELHIMRMMHRTFKAKERMDDHFWRSESSQLFQEEDTILLKELGVL